MKTRFNSLGTAGWLAVVAFFLMVVQSQAQPSIVGTVPANGATGVSTTAAVVFTFSEAMDTNATSVTLLNESSYAPQTATTNWSAGNTVLTLTPSPAFPAGVEILWVVQGQDTGANPLTGLPYGSFTTGTGSSGGGGTANGTNKYTSFTVGTAVQYEQNSAGAPVLDTSNTYLFLAAVSLASNRTATNVTVKLPSGDVTKLNIVLGAAYLWTFGASETNQTTLDDTYSNGDYLLTVSSVGSNQQVTIDLPSSLEQPNAPHVTNYAAAQSVNPANAFTLRWDAFTGGTSKDFITVRIGDVYQSPEQETSNALTGTATSFEIPASTLQSNMDYSTTIIFFKANVTSNNPSYTTAALRESATTFDLITSSGGGTPGPVMLGNASKNGSGFTFNVSGAASQSVTIQYSTDLGLSSSPWKTLYVTNTGTGTIQVNDSVNTGKACVIYRVEVGP